MKTNVPPNPEALRSLLLKIARASVASCMAGCVSTQLEGGEDTNAEPNGALVIEAGASVAADDGAAMRDAAPTDRAPAPEAGAPLGAGMAVDAAATSDAGVPVDGGRDLDGSASRDAAGGAAADADGGAMGWQRIACDRPGEPSELNTTRPTDAIGVYLEEFHDPALPQRPPHYIEFVRAGSLCSGADNTAACELQLEDLKREPSCANCLFALAGVGASYERIDASAELRELLGSIDTLAEALVLAAFEGHNLCYASEDPSAIVTHEARTTWQGFEVRTTREQCSGTIVSRRGFTVSRRGTIVLTNEQVKTGPSCSTGRRPAGLRPATARDSRTRIGAFLAQVAHLEAASVHAFHKLLRELRALGAPESLCDAALEALLDEVRHARDVGQLARAYGGDLVYPEVAAIGSRSAFALALENVGEGCVRETFGALQATYQAEAAADPRVRRLMAQIAEDETRHAALAWRLQAWLEPQLSEGERTQVQAERARVLEALAGELEAGLSREEHAALGLPTPEVASDMLRSLSQTLYA